MIPWKLNLLLAVTTGFITGAALLGRAEALVAVPWAFSTGVCLAFAWAGYLDERLMKEQRARVKRMEETIARMSAALPPQLMLVRGSRRGEA